MGGRRSQGAGRFVALMRGVNVGGNNLVNMKAVVHMFQSVGCSDVESYLQSGNIVFSAGPILAQRAPAMVSQLIHKEFGFAVPMVVRSGAELQALAGANPFLTLASEARYLMFLAQLPSEHQVAKLDTKRSPPDAFAVCGANVFLYLPNGAARTKLNTSYFDRALSTTSTVRNWNTVQKLVELSA